jgi:hypothetical protein
MVNVQIDLRVNNTVVRDQFLWVRARFLIIICVDYLLYQAAIK